MEEVIQVLHLSKKFKDLTAVDDLSFSVKKGEVYGFLGQNGAGKSTTIRMLLTLVKPTSGSIHIFGKDLLRYRGDILRQVGAIIEKPDLYTYLTALQNLKLMAELSGARPSAQQLLSSLERVGLSHRADNKVKTYSQGMKQRLGLACALIHNPQLIILDEPTNGLDPQGIADVRNLILHLSRVEGRTILVSSHLLSEIELIADSMLIIDRGKKVAEGKVTQLLNPAHTVVSIGSTNPERTRTVLMQSQWANGMQHGSAVEVKMDKNAIPSLVKFLTDHNIEITYVQPRHSLEEYFLSLTSANQHVAAYKD